MTRRVAIIGAAHRFPGTTPETFWQDLQAEKDLVTRVAEDRWSQAAYQHPDRRHPGTSVSFAAGSLGDISGFDADFFGISPREATSMDPQQRMLLELAWEAMESAGVVPASLRGSQCGVFLGIASLDYSYRLADDMAAIDASTATGNTSSIASNRLSYVFDLHGPSMSLDTACSSALVAFHQACQAIRSGETDMALAGGISLHLHPYGFIIFSKASMLSATGRCQVFDADGDGYVRSEGAGLFLLKDYAKAVADGDPILAVVAGSSVNTDGHKSGLTVPNPSAQAALMRQAYERAGIAPDEIDYLEAHGTGTAVGDPIETRAIGEALAKHRRAPLPIGSVKSNVGHLETASGVAGLAKALYSLQHREVPATIGIRRLNPHIKFDEWNLEVVTRAYPLRPEGRLVIGVNSFGFGGANAHVILESPPSTPAAPVDADVDAGVDDEGRGPLPLRLSARGEPALRGPLPLRLSARGEPALRAMAGDLAAWLEDSDADLYDIAHTLYRHREHHPDGALLFADSKAEAARRLAAFADADQADPPEVVPGKRLATPSAPGFIYAGNGCQWERMGADLLAGSAVFAAAVDEVDALFQRHADFSLRAELEGRNEEEANGEGAESRLARTEIAQPTLFAVQVGLTQLLRHHGIEPAAVAGHSVGEVAAAWACGALRLDEAVRVIYFRSHYQGKTRGQGQMSAVALGEAEIRDWLATGDYPGVHLAGINSARGVTLAGDADALERLEQALKEAGSIAKRLPLDYAFHSPAMDGIEAGVVASLADIAPRAETLPFVSTVTGERLAGTELGAAYWWHNIRRPVRFDAAIEALIDAGTRLFIEIGAHPILRRYLSDALGARECDGRVLATLERDKPAEACMDRAIGQALLSGMPLDERRWFPVAGRLVEPPRYPWQREHYWATGTSQGQKLLERDYEHPLLGYRLAQHDGTWESQLDTGRLPWLGDHVVGDGAVFPGAGFAELALAAARHRRDADCLDIEELEIRAPLLLDGQHGRRLRLHLARDDGRLEIRSREPLADGEWQLNAVARVMEQSRGFLLRRSAPALPAREPDITLAEHLAEAERLGLHYGPAFQAISQAWVEGDSILGIVEPPAAIEDTLGAMNLHPGILDSAFQLFIPLLAQEARRQGIHGDGMAFVPVRVGRLQLLTDGGVPALAHARMLKRAPHSFTADFELFDADGRAVAVLGETRFKAIRLRRQHHQRLSYLDVELTPAPRQAGGEALDLNALYAAMPGLVDDFTRLTGGRYAGEVDPLLDSLADAFAVEALQRLNGGATLTPARYRELTGAHLDGRRLLDQLLAQLEAAGRLTVDEHGWHLSDDAAERVAPEAIWQLLVRDYPDHFAPIQRLGRFGLHLDALLTGRATADDLGLTAEVLAHLTRQLPGAAGWQAIAGALRQALPRVLEALPTGQRLGLLEAGAAAPALGERLCDLLDPDRCDYAILGAGEQAWHQAEQLQQRFPLIDIARLEDDDDAESGSARLALISLEPGHRQRNRRLLQAASRRLAPGAHLLVVGIQPSAWLDTLLATPGLEDHGTLLQAMEGDDVTAELDALGARHIDRIPLEDDERGAYLIHAQWGQTPHLGSDPDSHLGSDPSADLGSDPQPPGSDPVLQLVADAASRPLAERLAAGLTARDHQVHIAQWGQTPHLGSDPQPPGSDPDLHIGVRPQGSPGGLTPTFVDLRRGERRCEQALQWAQTLEPLGDRASLWLVTHGVAPMWQEDSTPDNSGACQGDSAPMDAALWGFGRSLANESTGYGVRLLDLPDEDLDDAVIQALLDELTAPDAETEIVLDARGRRFATRLRSVAAPKAQPVQAPDAEPVQVQAPDAEPVQTLANEPGERRAMTLGFELPGQLRHLRWTPMALPQPSAGEVEIDVQATGLNFRDVMYTLGLLSDEAIENGFAGPTLGLEFSGVVAAVGDGVDDLAVGDAVVGFGPASFSDRLIASRQAVAPIPEGVSFAAAATIPTTFFTVYYALKHLARLAPGEKILIHGAAGGVGIAAIQVAQWLGAEIHASVGSDEKRDFLRLLGIEHFYDSRALTFGEEVLEATDGRGVDVVLNSLAGEAINQNLRALRPFGRFLELGKRDFYENTPIGLRPFRNNLSYFGIDSDQLMKELPELTGRLFGEMMALFQDGTLTPLPYTAFASQQVIEAFRYMQQARQIGKVVVTHEQAQVAAPSRPASGASLCLPAAASYLVTGGLGGFGLKTARWLAEHGARHLILVGRSGAASDEARAGVAELEALGVEVVAAACDITDRQALKTLLDECRAVLPPLRGVVHAATVIDDGLIRNLDEARLRRVLAPKVDGARHLDELTRDAALDFFVMYSSATTLFGNPGQASYVAANHWLEALAAARRHRGLPATCLRWGAIEDVGFLARNTRTRDALQERLGGSALRSDDALAVMEPLLLGGNDRLGGPSLGVLELDWSALARFLPTAQSPRFHEIARQADDDGHGDESDEDLAALFASLSPEALHTAVTDLLRAELAAILLIDEEKIDTQRSVYEMGFDSLMGVELMTAIEARIGINVPVMVLSEASTIDKLAGVLMQKLEHGEDAEVPSDAQQFANLTSQHGAEELGQDAQQAKGTPP
uniref:type I polyketide synthase n=1 Tax=uncultured Halomonas sp. TaxID=173971 RepID=UPI0026347915|nr:type I polyketide synthase [uncultured Halomonas sp.]